MDKFLDLAFRNHIRNNDKITDKFFVTLEPIMDEFRKYVSKEIADDIQDKLFIDLATTALEYAGVEGMKLAIGVIDGTIKQVIE